MSSPSEGDKGIDTSVGGLVWVRRRNGKWWPGRILGPDEMPDGCLPSPKAGTPIKLLGREDASVDWYNVEKSARVKAFRCGEYDDCIEKAKAAAAANSSKKVARYARREDAILHALEIESARLEKDNLDVSSNKEKQEEEEHIVEDIPSSFDPREEGTENLNEDSSSSEDVSDSAQGLSQSGVSFEDPNHTGASKGQSALPTPNDSEDDGAKGVKRMKGLDDLGMGVVSSLKRKRSQVAHVHEFLKKKHRRRTLTKVLENTAMVAVPVMCGELASPTGSLPPGASHRKCSESAPDESRKTFSLNENNLSSKFSENGSSEGLYDVPLVTEETQLAGHSPILNYASQKTRVSSGTKSSQSSQVETVSLASDELNESGSTSSATAELFDISQRVDNGTSMWKSKRKRSRHTSKTRRQGMGKSVDADDEYDTCLAGVERNVSCKTFAGSFPSDNSSYRLKSKAVSEFQVDDFRGCSRNVSGKDPYLSQTTAEMQTRQRLLPYRQSRLLVNPKYQDFSLGHHTAESSLFDVNLEVKASYRPQHVPYVSLMSKLSGRPIIGHPLTVEVLYDGFCDNLISGSECYSSTCELNEDLGENTSSVGGSRELGFEARSNSTATNPIKHTSQLRVSPSKSPKSRKNGFLSKKTRKLSSITGAHKQSKDNKMQVEKLKAPAIACIPLTIVFSRINEALNSSLRPAHRA